MAGFGSFREFYPFYLSEHRDRTCRRLHVIGSSAARRISTSMITMPQRAMVIGSISGHLR